MQACRKVLLAVGFVAALTLVSAQEPDEDDMPMEVSASGYAEDEHADAVMDPEDAEDMPPMDGELPDNEEGGGYEPVSKEKLEALFHKIDKDGDGKVARADLLTFAQHMTFLRAQDTSTELMADYDKNSDGEVTMDEVLEDGGSSYDEYFKNSVNLKFKAADKDGSSSLNEKELVSYVYPEIDSAVEEAHAQAEIKRKDRDKDGKLDIAEFFEHVAEVENPPDEVAEREEFNDLDADKDGYMSVAELQSFESGRHHMEQAMHWLADNIDTDSDGFLTMQELVDRREDIVMHDSSFHLEEWATHFEL